MFSPSKTCFAALDDLAGPPDVWQDDPVEVPPADLLDEALQLQVSSHPDNSDPDRVDFF